MSKLASREFILSRNGTPIAGVRTKSITIGNETIDFTDDDSDGNQELSDLVGRREVTISVGGVYNDDGLMSLALAENIQDDFTLTDTVNNEAISGTFNITSYAREGGGPESELEFSAEMASSGVITQGVPSS